MVYPYISEGRQSGGVYMSYTLGAAYGFPETEQAREVLLDESLIPFHVAIDISYGEQTALADIILPDATALERWDAHSTNSYGLRPYTGIRQPLVAPLGEARPAQWIWQQLAKRIGGGMETYFEFDDLEDYYQAWYSEVPVEWEELKRDGIWTDPQRPLDYELYERPVPESELVDALTDPETGIVYRMKGQKKVPIGILRDGRVVRGFDTPTRTIMVEDPIFPLAAQSVGLPLDDVNASLRPVYAKVPEHVDLSDEEYVFTTFKWNVHTQGRSAYWKHASEIVHTNDALMAPGTACKLGVETGDWVDITVYRPKGHVYRAGEEAPVGTLRNRVRVVPGMHGRVISCSHHMGHWEHGPVARAAEGKSPGAPGMETEQLLDPDIRDNLWWSEANGGAGGGVALNRVLPINANPLVGGQNWFDNVCQVEKVS